MEMATIRYRSLCTTCIACLTYDVGYIGSRPDPVERVYHHHRTVATWKASLEATCLICTTLWQSITIQQRKAVESIQGETRLTIWGIDEKLQEDSSQLIRFRAMVVVPPEVTTIGSIRSLCKFVLDPRAETALAYSTRSRSRTTFDALPFGKEWLSSCCQKHQGCRVRRARWLPTRLLEISENNIRLVVTTRLLAFRRPKYATLSHCWGNAQILKLQKSTLCSFQTGINHAQLPLTFKNAIYVTRYLGIRYLWIDSLCIIQDDRDDWSKQASLMYKVYANSHVNVAASAARDSREGLFFTRDPEIEFLPVCITLPDTCRWTNGVQKTFTVVCKYALSDDLDQAPLNNRGWVLQERLLAPRVLHFGLKQLVWECQEQLLCEQHPYRLPPDVSVSRFMTLKEAFVKDTALRAPFYRYWRELVTEYTRCSLTEPSDKSVAFSGIVKHMQTKTHDRYIAGMWREKLPWSLTWYVADDSQMHSSRPIPRRAPSWSWLSIDGRIIENTPSDDDSLHFDIIDVEMDYTDSDLTGQIKGGYLELCGNLRRVRILLKDECTEKYRFRFTLELESGPLLNGHDYMDFLLDVWQPDFAESNEKGDLFVMPAWGPGQFAACVHYMLLLKHVEAKHGVFERIGVLLFSLDEKAAIMTTLLAHDDDEGTIPCVTFDPVKRQHTIRLI